MLLPRFPGVAAAAAAAAAVAALGLLESPRSVASAQALPPRSASSTANPNAPPVNPRRQRFAYVILGSGTTAQAAMETLKAGDPSKEILIIGPHTVLPRMDGTEIDKNASLLDARLGKIYNEWRRQLSNSVSWDGDRVSMLRTADVAIDLERRIITTTAGSSGGGEVEIEYEQCLLATAGRPREFYVLDSDKLNWGTCDQINILYTPLDFQNLSRTAAEGGRHITVVGGGYLGTETVCALAESKQCKITHVLGERAPLAQYLPRYLSDYIGRKLRASGVDIREETLVTGLGNGNAITLDGGDGGAGGEDRLKLDLVGKSQTLLETDYLVLASTNVTADLMGLDQSCKTGLEIAMGGVMVNASLEAYRNFFVAGNAATYFDPNLGRRRVDTYDHAVASGMWAAHNMLSDTLGKYTHQPTFKSSLAGLGMNLVGIGRIDAKLETVGVWYRHQTSSSLGEEEDGVKAAAAVTATTTVKNAEEEFKRGIVYYLENGRVVGVLLCNAKEMATRARDVLNAQRVLTDPVQDLPKTILLAPSHWLSVISSKPAKLVLQS